MLGFQCCMKADISHANRHPSEPVRTALSSDVAVVRKGGCTHRLDIVVRFWNHWNTVAEPAEVVMNVSNEIDVVAITAGSGTPLAVQRKKSLGA